MNLALTSSDKPAAFTLLEVILAVLVSAIVLAALNAVFFGALRLRLRMAGITEQTLPRDYAVETMKRDLVGIVPPGVLAGPMGSDVSAVGMTQPAALEIYTTTGATRTDVPWGDMQRVDYSLQEPTNRTATTTTGRDLMRGVTRNLLASTPEPPEQQLLLSDVQTLQFSYYDGTNWNDSWSQTLSNIPVAVKVSIEFAPAASGGIVNLPLKFLVPVVSQSRTNQTDNGN
jgi:prepilin-type N-terminal cleavage/methylation domain-containing protein